MLGNGLVLWVGAIVGATIISSTRSKEGSRGPERHRAKKGHEWHFGMKVHIGVGEAFGVIHSLSTTVSKARGLAGTFSCRLGRSKARNAIELLLEQATASIHTKGGHPFRAIKRQFGCDKVRYQGLDKNIHRLAALPVFANLFMCKKMLPAESLCDWILPAA